MRAINCSVCKRKLLKREKFGQGEVLRCLKSCIERVYDYRREGDKILCAFGKEIGIDKGSLIKMIKGFIYSGIKRN